MSKRMDKKAAKAAFAKYDADKNGYLTLNEFTKFMCDHFEEKQCPTIESVIYSIFL